MGEMWGLGMFLGEEGISAVGAGVLVFGCFDVSGYLLYGFYMWLGGFVR